MKHEVKALEKESISYRWRLKIFKKMCKERMTRIQYLPYLMKFLPKNIKSMISALEIKKNKNKQKNEKPWCKSRKKDKSVSKTKSICKTILTAKKKASSVK